MSADVPGRGRRVHLRSNQVQGVAIPTVDISELSFAEANCILSIAWKTGWRSPVAADNLKHLRSRRLLLQRFVQFASKPSDFRLLGS